MLDDKSIRSLIADLAQKQAGTQKKLDKLKEMSDYLIARCELLSNVKLDIRQSKAILKQTLKVQKQQIEYQTPRLKLIQYTNKYFQGNLESHQYNVETHQENVERKLLATNEIVNSLEAILLRLKLRTP